mmetsp:Transcript_24201/g.52193  ORF Transcript_24201/g.52193 Transcript_24201/m.52193 type:complete len:437 (+) Transcript_24201:431-1741(+)|eukprot:CAMPEP_0172317066 /NCGR_PEP_ID=MMETSP1058-20130122/30432_1 /TAXON_ID=83371 /ORGANISM="Detonula confervacea, Strain CCMP 353" /LENGTH=436 /DNA_ID=CAMNT_0013031521 /DNA_START=332 /DNA_END=1642 /DNA_ORIENTATION=-
MLATSSIVDPLLTSPQRARRHDDDKAALHTISQIPSLELPPSLSAVVVSSDHRHSAVNEISIAHAKEEEEGAETTPFQQLMNRGGFLRQLRLLALEDERERERHAARNVCARSESTSYDDCAGSSICEEKKEDFDDNSIPPASDPSFPTLSRDDVQELQDNVHILPTTKEKVLDYNSYLAHQRYYDDLKHVDIKYMNFGNIHNYNGDVDGGELIVEQRKQLGKGGFCWDAGFILGEHVIAREEEWNAKQQQQTITPPPRVVELGAGTGLSGLMIAKATRSQVEITDLPELEDLMRENIDRNFSRGDCIDINNAAMTDESSSKQQITTHDDKAKGTITSRILRWGMEDDYPDTPYDVIIGADIVASIYDPVALAQTLHALSGPSTSIYISIKSRLDKPHEEFDVEMNRLFRSVKKIKPSSRLRNPDVFIIVAEGKKC